MTCRYHNFSLQEISLCDFRLSRCVPSYAPVRSINTASAEAGRSGWYFSVGTGLALSSGMDQEGWNRDTVCYPTDPCFVADPVPALAGYRWGYAIDADAGTEVDVTFGRALGSLRLEVSASQSKNNIEQEFVSLEYFDGSPWTGREDGTVVSNDVASIGNLTTRIVALNVYRDFSAAHRALTPYIGVGLGAAFVKVSDVKYENDYQDTAESPPELRPAAVVLQQHHRCGLFRYGGRRSPIHLVPITQLKRPDAARSEADLYASR